MATNNTKGTPDNNKTNPTGPKPTHLDNHLQVEGDANAKTGGQVNGGIIIQSGNRTVEESGTQPQ